MELVENAVEDGSQPLNALPKLDPNGVRRVCPLHEPLVVGIDLHKAQCLETLDDLF